MQPAVPSVNKVSKEPSASEKKGENPLKMQEKAPKEQKKGVEAEQKNAELTELLQRTRAEFENFQKRTQKEKMVFLEFAQGEIVQRLLPLWDALEEALKHSSSEQKKALEPIAKAFTETLQKMGLQTMETTGKKFNPLEHDCLLTGHDTSQPEDSVLEELQKGFLFKGRVLRHAKVKVNHLEQKGVAENENK